MLYILTTKEKIQKNGTKEDGRNVKQIYGDIYIAQEKNKNLKRDYKLGY